MSVAAPQETERELRAGARLAERRVVAAELVAYPHAFTSDILPASTTGTYLAAGALVGSTLSGDQRPDGERGSSQRWSTSTGALLVITAVHA